MSKALVPVILLPAMLDASGVHSPRLRLCLRQGQHMYSIPPGGFRHPYPALAMNASMSRWADQV